MNYFRLLSVSLMALLSGLCLPLSAQRILRIVETDVSNGKIYNVDSTGLGIININSTLKIYPDRDAIRNMAIQQFGDTHQGKMLVSKSEQIKKILQNQQSLIDAINRNLLKPDTANRQLIFDLRALISEVKKDTGLRSDYNAYSKDFYQNYAGKPGYDPFLFVLEKFNRQLEDITITIKELEKSSKIRFSLTAHRRDKSGGTRLHVENFDLFDNGEFYNVDSWVINLSKDQMKELDNYQHLAQSLNTDARGVLNAYKQKLLDQLPSLYCIQGIHSEIDSAITTLPQDVQSIILQSIDDLEQSLQTLELELTQIQPENAGEVVNIFNRYLDKLKEMQATLQDRLLALPQTNVHAANIIACVQQTILDVEKIHAFIQKIPTRYLQKVYLASDELADEIIAFDLDKIPDVGTLDLRYTGRRDVGDEIVIKALYRLPDDTINQRKITKTIDEWNMKMVQTGPHSVTKIGLLIAKSYTNQSDFRFVPSAALLLKRGSRKSHFYNNFLDPAIGLNSCSPDFDGDGVPEFAAGVTVTLFRDVISAGWDWNFGTNKPMYFLGIHLPFNLPGLPVNTIQSNPLGSD